MSRWGRLLQVWPTARHEQAITAERDLRAPLPVVRRIGFASLRGGTGCSTAARGVASTLDGRRRGGVLLLDADEAGSIQSPLSASGTTRAPELTLTDWGSIDAARLSTISASSHVLCLTSTTERSAVQQALDAASFVIESGTPTVLVASSVRGKATPAVRRMLASSPVPVFLLPFDRTVRLGEPGARSSASAFALATLGAEIVRLGGRPSAEVLVA
ncbi:hypothetical protein [Microbacterium murale]|uniref:Uncharacterized protein n=1 Tax=Microbacterium murale TaxID=1081040 RepID=A0ABU0P472_9MICO|nr:hypothetical protein [Microbacterium murale]MDQ0642128.1 hypothetical protein [Microbacterium murale]